MKKFTRSLEKHPGIVFATTTPHGVGALHLRHKLPYYKIRRACDALGLFITSEVHHRNHMKLYNKQGELVGTLVNLNLLLLPKYSKIKNDAIALAEELLKALP
jgi:hypothetical protein